MAVDEVEHGEILAEFERLHARLDAHYAPPLRRPHHSWLRRVVKGLEDDPKVQVRIHKWACVYWLVNFPIVAFLFFGLPSAWVYVGLLLNTFYSLYANLATDYDGLSSSQASLHARKAAELAAEEATARKDGA